MEDLFDIYINRKILIFPTATLYIFWSDKTLSRTILLGNKRYSLQEAIKSCNLFNKYKYKIVEQLIRNLPSVLIYKLGLTDKQRLKMFRNTIVQAMTY